MLVTVFTVCVCGGWVGDVLIVARYCDNIVDIGVNGKLPSRQG